MSLHRVALRLAMGAKAGVLNPADVLALVVRAAARLDPRDPLWRAIREFGRAVAADPDPLGLADAGDQLLTDLGVTDEWEG